jgi:hypothetical protein
VRLEDRSLAIDTGAISMKTGEGIQVALPEDLKFYSAASRITIFARDLKITPASPALTEFDVTRSNGLIAVTARRNTVIVSCGSRTSQIEEGHQVSRPDKAACGLSK